jgi:hypothetical protein
MTPAYGPGSLSLGLVMFLVLLPDPDLVRIARAVREERNSLNNRMF